MIRADLHVHSTYCDGKNTLEEMVQAAVCMGMDCIGFTGHSYTPFELTYCMSQEGTVQYREELARLREIYGDRIRILTGIEEDYYSEDDPADYDYVIGSVHYIRHEQSAPAVKETMKQNSVNGQDTSGTGASGIESDKEQDISGMGAPSGGSQAVYLPVDDTREIQLADIDQYFGGDVYAYAERYYELVSDIVRKTDCDIIGHFDLVTKFNEKDPYIDTKHPRYRAAWQKAADILLTTGKPFEINTGAISRGYRTEPYPSREIREYLRDHGAKLFLTGDSHAADTLMYRFGDFREYENVETEEVIRGFRRNKH